VDGGEDDNQICFSPPNLQVTGRTPLHIACEKKQFDLVEVLVEGGVDVASIDGRGLTVLHYQETLAAPAIVLYLLRKGLSVNTRHKVPTKDLCDLVHQLIFL
jgi:ankyrin repeat protein